MSTSPSPPRPLPKKWILAGAILLLVGAYFAYRAVLRAKVDEEIAKIRAEGYPTTGEELEAYYPEPPSGQNAAPIYLRAFAKLDTNVPEADQMFVPHFGNTSDFPPLGEPMSAEMKRAIDDLLAKNEEVLATLHQAAEIPSCRYPIRLQDGNRADMPHLTKVGYAGWLLDLAVARSVESDLVDEAVNRLIDTHHLARSMHSEPTLLSQLVRYAVIGIVIDEAERLLSKPLVEDPRLCRLSNSFVIDEHSTDYARGVAGDRACALMFFRSGDHLSNFLSFRPAPPTWVERATELAYRTSGHFDMDQIEYIRIVTEHIRAAQDPNPLQRIKTNRAITARLPIVPFHRIPVYEMEALFGAIKQDVSAIARIRAARAAFAVERHRLAKGSLPDTLADLVPEFLPEVPGDPYSDPPTPLQYVRRPKGYVVYSIGDDGVDDGGDQEDQKDVTFEVAR